MKITEVFKIRTLFLKLKDSKMPLNVGYQIARFLHQTKVHADFYQESYQRILDENAQKNENGEFIIAEDGTSIKLIEEQAKKCIAEINELENIEIEDVSLNLELSDLELLNLTVEDLYLLMPYIKE